MCVRLTEPEDAQISERLPVPRVCVLTSGMQKAHPCWFFIMSQAHGGPKSLPCLLSPDICPRAHSPLHLVPDPLLVNPVIFQAGLHTTCNPGTDRRIGSSRQPSGTLGVSGKSGLQKNQCQHQQTNKQTAPNLLHDLSPLCVP